MNLMTQLINYMRNSKRMCVEFVAYRSSCKLQVAGESELPRVVWPVVSIRRRVSGQISALLSLLIRTADHFLALNS